MAKLELKFWGLKSSHIVLPKLSLVTLPFFVKFFFGFLLHFWWKSNLLKLTQSNIPIFLFDPGLPLSLPSFIFMKCSSLFPMLCFWNVHISSLDVMSSLAFTYFFAHSVPSARHVLFFCLTLGRYPSSKHQLRWDLPLLEVVVYRVSFPLGHHLPTLLSFTFVSSLKLHAPQ